MWFKIGQVVIFIALVSVLTLGQLSFILALPTFFKALNLILIFLVFALFFYDLRTASAFVLISGFWSDLLSFHFFGFYLIVLFLTVWAAAGILTNWLTNRSLYSFLLLIITVTLIYNFLLGILSYLFFYDRGQFILFQSSFWLFLVYQIAWSALAAIFLFSLASAFTKRFKPFFLERH